MSDTNILLNRAKSALIARDYQLATRLYKTLIDENPDVVDYKVQLGNLFVKSGKDDQALDVYKQVLKKTPGDHKILMAMSGIYRRQKKYEESVAVLESALILGSSKSEEKAEISYNLGFTYRQMGKNNDAIRCFEDVIDINPKDVLAYNHLGAIYAIKGDHEKAVDSYQRGLQFDPNHPILHFNLARSLATKGDSSKALSHYEAALKAKPGWLDAIEEYANLLLKTNRVKEADDVVTNALKLNPDDVKMHTSMGNVYNRKSIFESAEVEFKKALDNDDEYKPALTGLAHSQEKLGKLEEAAETIGKAHRLNPDDVSIIKQSAHVLLSANFLSAAYEKISKLWEINQKDLQTINLLGQYYIAKGDEGKIESCFDKIQSIDPEYKDVYRDWGHRYLQKGDNKNAEQYLQAAIQQNPKDAESMMFLAELYECEKQPEKALEMYKKANAADSFNHLSAQEISRLKEEGVRAINFDISPVSLSVSPIAEGSSEEKKEEDSSLLDDAFALNKDFEDSDAENGESEEISMAEDDTQFNEDIEEEDSGDDAFDFDQFGIEKLSVENPEEAVSIADIMKLDDDMSMDGNPDDFDELVDDGSPVDEDDDPHMEFIPDGSDLMDSAEGNLSEPDHFVGDEDEDEEEDFPDIMDSSEWEPVAKETQKESEPEAPKAELSEETLKNIEDQIRAAAEIAEKANETAEKAMKAAENAFDSLAAKKDAMLDIETVEPPLLQDEQKEEAEEEIGGEAEQETPVEDSEDVGDAAEDSIEDEPFEFDETSETEENEEETAEQNEQESQDEPAGDIENNVSELSQSELMLKRAIDMLPDIVNAIEDRQMLFRFKTSLEMFKKLREMLEYLPEMQRKEFLTSRNRVLLDYIISKLSGKPGLFATAKALVASGIIHENPSLKPSEKEGIELTKEVLENLHGMADSLEDETLRFVLKCEGEDLLLKLPQY